MTEVLFTTRVPKIFAAGAMAGIALTFASMPSQAADPIQPPPYVIAEMTGVTVNVVWDEAAIRKALPPGVEPAKGMTGGINIYHADRGYLITPYSAVYFYVDIEGFDTPEKLKGRWMLAGAYGPQPKTSMALKASGFPVRPGESRLEPTAGGKRAIGMVNGQDIVTAEIKSVPNSCEPGGGLLNYPTMSPETERVVVNKIPFAGDLCKADLVSAKITAPSGDPFSAYPIAKVTGASEFRNGAAAFTLPQPAGK